MQLLGRVRTTREVLYMAPFCPEKGMARGDSAGAVAYIQAVAYRISVRALLTVDALWGGFTISDEALHPLLAFSAFYRDINNRRRVPEWLGGTFLGFILFPYTLINLREL
jgi:hypothetical protein